MSSETRGSSALDSGSGTRHRRRKRQSPKEVKVTVLQKGEGSYSSMDEARRQLQDLIRRNKSMMQGAREREFQIIHEEF